MRIARLLASAISIAAAGCAGPPAPPLELLPVEDARPASLVRGLHERSESRAGLRGAARLSLDAPDLRLRRPQRLAVERPAKMRIEILALFGQVAGVLAADGDRYQFLDVSKRELEEGAVTPDLLWRLARVELRTEEAVALLLGTPVPEAGLVPGRAWASSEGALEVEFIDPSGRERQRFGFDRDGRLARISAIADGGIEIWSAEYSDYRRLGEESFPHVLELRFPQRDAVASLRFSEVELNPELDESLFRLPPL